MSRSLIRSWLRSTPPAASLLQLRHLRSEATLEALAKAAEEKPPVIALYNYPSFSGAYSALFTQLFHSHLRLPCLILPFSSVIPFRVICFDHRKSTLAKVPSAEDCPMNVKYHVDVARSSSRAVYDYFSRQLECTKSPVRIEELMDYLEDGDLLKWSLPDIRAFNIGISEWRSKLNCITNPHMYEQLTEMSAKELITKGNSQLSTRKDAAKKFLLKAFKLRLGRGFFGECLGVRADSNPDLSDEIGNELSKRSAAAGLRPVGAVIYMQRKNLKVCLRSTDGNTDTSEIAKAYGGGGSPRSSSFIIRMDEYNHWRSVNISS
ncbi:Oligoribonuclease NrnB [Bienertia sinuspersici]